MLVESVEADHRGLEMRGESPPTQFRNGSKIKQAISQCCVLYLAFSRKQQVHKDGL